MLYHHHYRHRYRRRLQRTRAILISHWAMIALLEEARLGTYFTQYDMTRRYRVGIVQKLCNTVSIFVGSLDYAHG